MDIEINLFLRATPHIPKGISRFFTSEVIKRIEEAAQRRKSGPSEIQLKFALNQFSAPMYLKNQPQQSKARSAERAQPQNIIISKRSSPIGF